MNEPIKLGPPSHAALRALMQLCDAALRYGDGTMLNNIYTIASTREYDTPALSRFVDALSERIGGTEPEYYIHDSDTMEIDRKELEELMYGDFDEAMAALEHDLIYIDERMVHPGYESDIFQPKWFTLKQRRVWTELRQVVEEFRQAPKQDHLVTADKARTRLRQYQQQSYGELISVMVATYIKRSGSSVEGVSVQLTWHKTGVVVQGVKELSLELQDYLSRQSQVAKQGFDSHILPEHLAGYTLGSATVAKLFAFEL